MAAYLEDDETRKAQSRFPGRGLRPDGGKAATGDALDAPQTTGGGAPVKVWVTPRWATALAVLGWLYASRKVLQSGGVEPLRLWVVVSALFFLAWLVFRKRGQRRAAGVPSAYAFLNADRRRLPGEATRSTFGLPEYRGVEETGKSGKYL